MSAVVALRHVPHEGLGTLGATLARAGIAVEIVDLFATVPPQLPADLAGLVVMGGPMNVDETTKYPFLAQEIEWIRVAVHREVPILGICLGSQLLAKALGAKVSPNRVKEIGWYEIELLPAAEQDPLFHDFPQRETVFQWHGDTFNLPSGAIQLARGQLCEQQAFRFGPVAYGLQFHLEMTAPMIEDWLCETGGCAEIAALEYIDPAVIRRDTPTKIPQLNQHAERIFARFAALCTARSAPQLAPRS